MSLTSLRDIGSNLNKMEQFASWVAKHRHTVYPKKYAHGFVVLCFVVVMQSFIMNSHEVFIHIHQGGFAGTGAIVRLPQCQWSKPDGYGKISQCITTTKHSKAKTVCIFLGIYCTLSLYIAGYTEIIKVTISQVLEMIESDVATGENLVTCHIKLLTKFSALATPEVVEESFPCSQWRTFLQNKDNSFCVYEVLLMISIANWYMIAYDNLTQDCSYIYAISVVYANDVCLF